MTRTFSPILWLPALLAAAFSLPQPAEAGDRHLTVMTYNVYLGGDTGPILSSPPAEIPLRVAAAYRQTMASEYHERAASIAGSIAAHRPHLVALQEVSIIRRQTPGDIMAGQAAPNAADVVLEFLPMLTAALDTKSAEYHVAARVENTDVEMPMLTDDGSIDDVRLTTFDVILSRGDVPVSRVVAANYETVLTSPLGFSIGRGYAALDAEVSGSTYRFVSTHLEAFSSEVRKAQAAELIAVLEGETLPLIVAGDFNSDAGAPQGDPSRTVHDLLISHGYEDAWRGDPGTGATCCQAPDLRNAESGLTWRIDHVLIRNIDPSAVSETATVGERPSDRVPSGLWPSDHAGVVVSLALD